MRAPVSDGAIGAIAAVPIRKAIPSLEPSPRRPCETFGSTINVRNERARDGSERKKDECGEREGSDHERLQCLRGIAGLIRRHSRGMGQKRRSAAYGPSSARAQAGGEFKSCRSRA